MLLHVGLKRYGRNRLVAGAHAVHADNTNVRDTQRHGKPCWGAVALCASNLFSFNKLDVCVCVSKLFDLRK